MSHIDKVRDDSQQEIPINYLSIRDITTVLIKHYDLHEGYFDLAIEFNIGVGAVGPDPESLTPGAMVGVSKIGLIQSQNAGPKSIDASVVNPKKKSRKIK